MKGEVYSYCVDEKEAQEDEEQCFKIENEQKTTYLVF